MSDHRHRPAGPNDERSPCPALNTLANHRYIDHSGKDISLAKLVEGLMRVYNLAEDLATFLAITGIVLCSDWSDKVKLQVDLHDLALHGAIEHDYSLAHADANGQTYAPTTVDTGKLDELLKMNKDNDYLTKSDLEQHRKNLINKTKDKKPLDRVHQKVADGEVSMILGIFGKDVETEKDGKKVTEKHVSKDFLGVWIGQEKLPEGWTKPKNPITFEEKQKFQDLVEKVEKLMDHLRKKEITEAEGVALDILEKLKVDRVRDAVLGLFHRSISRS